MTIGPVQLLVLGFAHPDFEGEIITELQRLRDNDMIRVIDALAVHRDAAGNLAAAKGSQLTGEAAAEFGAVVGPLIGYGTDNAAPSVGDSTDDDADDAWDVLGEIPDDTAAALILIEHRWAIPLRDAIARAGGFRLAAEYISPLDLVTVGLVSPEVAVELAAADRDAL